MLKNKNVIITGARRGIGRSCVEVFATNGANVFACSRSYDEEFEKSMNELSKKYNVIVKPVYFDITDEAQIKEAVKTIRKDGILINGLVNVAGIVETSSSFAMTSFEKMKNVFDANFWGLTYLTQYVSRLMMRNSSGAIVNISSIAGIDGTPAQYEYASSKAAVNGATKQLSIELAQHNIRVNAIAPGVIDTQMGSQVGDELMKLTNDRTSMHRKGKPEEIANVAAFLISDMSSYITGQVIRVDGGMF